MLVSTACSLNDGFDIFTFKAMASGVSNNEMHLLCKERMLKNEFSTSTIASAQVLDPQL